MTSSGRRRGERHGPRILSLRELGVFGTKGVKQGAWAWNTTRPLGTPRIRAQKVPGVWAGRTAYDVLASHAPRPDIAESPIGKHVLHGSWAEAAPDGSNQPLGRDMRCWLKRASPPVVLSVLYPREPGVVAGCPTAAFGWFTDRTEWGMGSSGLDRVSEQPFSRPFGRLEAKRAPSPVHHHTDDRFRRRYLTSRCTGEIVSLGAALL